MLALICVLTVLTACSGDDKDSDTNIKTNVNVDTGNIDVKTGNIEVD